MNCRNRSRRLLGAKFKNPYLYKWFGTMVSFRKSFFSLLLVDRAIPKAQKISPPYSVTGKSQLLCNPAAYQRYSIQFYTTLIAKYYTLYTFYTIWKSFVIFSRIKILDEIDI